jgi:hypothetical protein
LIVRRREKIVVSQMRGVSKDEQGGKSVSRTGGLSVRKRCLIVVVVRLGEVVDLSLQPLE